MYSYKPDHDYSQEIDCHYRDEKYSVRDNGAIFRYPREGKKARPNDTQWTFGKPNLKTGYMELASVPIHRIIATAFHGESPTNLHVVDHRDTNKKNNRPQNLRWVTRLENVLLNPITARRIALVCGSVEDFISDPSKFRDLFPEPNLQWMCTVNAQEAQYSKERLLNWANSGNKPSGGTLDNWIFNRGQEDNSTLSHENSDIVVSKTQNAVQRNWRIPSEFPCCPIESGNKPIATYFQNLTVGCCFCSNERYSSLVLLFTLADNSQSIVILTENADKNGGIKPFALAKVTYENGSFVHDSLGTFFTAEGANKQYCLSQGLEWSGGDSIDDYC